MLSKRTERALREAASRIDWTSPALSFRRLREASERIADLHEANSVTTFGWLLRSAVQEFANQVYNDLAVIYPNFVTVIQSRRRSEIYGGLYRGTMPRRVDAGEKFQDTSFKGFERELVNHKVGHLESFERELFDDDQTGQIRARAGGLGENFRIYEEIYVISRLFGAARSEEGVDVPASNYNSGNVFTTAIGNRPSSFARIAQQPLEDAHVAMRMMVDPIGHKFLVNPTTILVSPIDEMNTLRLLNSPVMPNTAASATANLINPLQGRYTVYTSPFVKPKAWLLGDFKKGFVFQRRDELEVVQENPNSGMGFEQEIYAFRARERFEADWIEPRFAYLGDDGSV